MTVTESGRKQFRVKTYARRESRITPAQKRALAELLSLYELPLTDAPICVSEVFPGTSRFAIEIGFGDGETLVHRAQQNKNTAYLGIEVYRPGVGKCLLRLHKNNVNNVRVSTNDARDVLLQQVPSNAVNEFIILFPDPWPKLRHRKRRLVNSEFVELCVDRLVIGGTILIVTDSSDYAQQVLEILEVNPNLESLAPIQDAAEVQDRRQQTRYARKAGLSGNQVFEMLYTRSECRSA